MQRENGKTGSGVPVSKRTSKALQLLQEAQDKTLAAKGRADTVKQPRKHFDPILKRFGQYLQNANGTVDYVMSVQWSYPEGAKSRHAKYYLRRNGFTHKKPEETSVMASNPAFRQGSAPPPPPRRSSVQDEESGFGFNPPPLPERNGKKSHLHNDHYRRGLLDELIPQGRHWQLMKIRLFEKALKLIGDKSLDVLKKERKAHLDAMMQAVQDVDIQHYVDKEDHEGYLAPGVIAFVSYFFVLHMKQQRNEHTMQRFMESLIPEKRVKAAEAVIRARQADQPDAGDTVVLQVNDQYDRASDGHYAYQDRAEFAKMVLEETGYSLGNHNVSDAQVDALDARMKVAAAKQSGGDVLDNGHNYDMGNNNVLDESVAYDLATTVTDEGATYELNMDGDYDARTMLSVEAVKKADDGSDGYLQISAADGVEREDSSDAHDDTSEHSTTASSDNDGVVEPEKRVPAARVGDDNGSTTEDSDNDEAIIDMTGAELDSDSNYLVPTVTDRSNGAAAHDKSKKRGKRETTPERSSPGSEASATSRRLKVDDEEKPEPSILFEPRPPQNLFSKGLIDVTFYSQALSQVKALLAGDQKYTLMGILLDLEEILHKKHGNDAIEYASEIIAYMLAVSGYADPTRLTNRFLPSEHLQDHLPCPQFNYLARQTAAQENQASSSWWFGSAPQKTSVEMVRDAEYQQLFELMVSVMHYLKSLKQKTDDEVDVNLSKYDQIMEALVDLYLVLLRDAIEKDKAFQITIFAQEGKDKLFVAVTKPGNFGSSDTEYYRYATSITKHPFFVKVVNPNPDINDSDLISSKVNIFRNKSGRNQAFDPYGKSASEMQKCQFQDYNTNQVYATVASTSPVVPNVPAAQKRQVLDKFEEGPDVRSIILQNNPDAAVRISTGKGKTYKALHPKLEGFFINSGYTLLSEAVDIIAAAKHAVFTQHHPKYSAWENFTRSARANPKTTGLVFTLGTAITASMAYDGYNCATGENPKAFPFCNQAPVDNSCHNFEIVTIVTNATSCVESPDLACHYKVTGFNGELVGPEAGIYKVDLICLHQINNGSYTIAATIQGFPAQSELCLGDNCDVLTSSQTVDAGPLFNGANGTVTLPAGFSGELVANGTVTITNAAGDTARFNIGQAPVGERLQVTPTFNSPVLARTAGATTFNEDSSAVWTIRAAPVGDDYANLKVNGTQVGDVIFDASNPAIQAAVNSGTYVIDDQTIFEVTEPDQVLDLGNFTRAGDDYSVGFKPAPNRNGPGVLQFEAIPVQGGVEGVASASYLSVDYDVTPRAENTVGFFSAPTAVRTAQDPVTGPNSVSLPFIVNATENSVDSGPVAMRMELYPGVTVCQITCTTGAGGNTTIVFHEGQPATYAYNGDRTPLVFKVASTDGGDVGPFTEHVVPLDVLDLPNADISPSNFTMYEDGNATITFANIQVDPRATFSATARIPADGLIAFSLPNGTVVTFAAGSSDTVVDVSDLNLNQNPGTDLLFAPGANINTGANGQAGNSDPVSQGVVVTMLAALDGVSAERQVFIFSYIMPVVGGARINLPSGYTSYPSFGAGLGVVNVIIDEPGEIVVNDSITFHDMPANTSLQSSTGGIVQNDQDFTVPLQKLLLGHVSFFADPCAQPFAQQRKNVSFVLGDHGVFKTVTDDVGFAVSCTSPAVPGLDLCALNSPSCT